MSRAPRRAVLFLTRIAQAQHQETNTRLTTELKLELFLGVSNISGAAIRLLEWIS
ncbi:hypothetical protein CASFOL_009453 [Castilleja foliolosa]|uniref:Uncharacterized protein n=1 Tax=Castilleja foliolosa TaxID=1961234 RepID=A0ABD3E1C3_9LAMI